MCKFCHQHGEGKKWYLQARHYAEDLLNDLERRRYIKEFIFRIGNGSVSDREKDFHRAQSLPASLRRLAYRYYERECRRDHFGQVVPLEDLDRVLDLTNSIVRLPCICRKNTTGAREARYCFGLSMDPEKLLEIREAFLQTFEFGPHDRLFERLSKSAAVDLLRSFEREGLIHTIWTFKTPFIGAICNCDKADCLAMMAYRYEFRLFFRGEWVGEVEEKACTGCRACSTACQFGALGYAAARRRAFIDPLRCYGCGTCRTFCDTSAIRLRPRADHPLARKLW